MASYGWAIYDIRAGGTQIINDTKNNLDLITEFAKISDGELEGNWGLRVKGIPRGNVRDHQKTTIIYYLGSEDPNYHITCVNENTIDLSKNDTVCNGTMAELGDFSVQIHALHGALQGMSLRSLVVPGDSIWQAKTTFVNQLKSDNVHEGMVPNDPGEGNLHFLQKTFKEDFKFDILFSSSSKLGVMTSQNLAEGVQTMLSSFRVRFDHIYPPKAPFQGEQYVKFSQSLLSNLMGGIGYFYGTSKVDHSAIATPLHENTEERGPYQLFTAVPSRPFFPRGFLWDEGFHLQVIMDWDMDLALEIVSSWFDLMDGNGWIAREQILGPEARSKVPFEFQAQHRDHANPPTLFFVIQKFVQTLTEHVSVSDTSSLYLRDRAAGIAFLTTIYPKMKKHYEWFCRTQAGNLTNYQLLDYKVDQGYRWRGRTSQHIFTSGLDDYPRAQTPHPEELHIDALSWVGFMAVALKKISAFLGEKKDEHMFLKHEVDIMQSIDHIHWSDINQAYCDTTIIEGGMLDKVCHKGYVSLFPFLTGLMGHDHPNIEPILDLIRDPEELWSPYGLRSLSSKDEYYGVGENYWRSPVWININFMALQNLLVSILRQDTFYASISSISAHPHVGSRPAAWKISAKGTRNIYGTPNELGQDGFHVLGRDRLCMGAV